MAHQPVGTGSSIPISIGVGHARTSGVISHMSDTLRVAIVGDSEIQGAHVAISKSEFSPAADATNYLVLKDKPTTITLNRPSSQRVVGITTGSTTYIDFPEGTGCPFEAGDAVSLTVTNGGGGDQSYYDFSHKIVNSVNTTQTGANQGYYSTRINVNYDYGDDNPGGIQTTFNNAGQVSWAEMRSSFMVGAQAAGALGAQGTGALYIQQVQTSGDA